MLPGKSQEYIRCLPWLPHPSPSSRIATPRGVPSAMSPPRCQLQSARPYRPAAARNLGLTRKEGDSQNRSRATDGRQKQSAGDDVLVQVRAGSS